MAEYDGSIRINTKIDSKNASAQLMALENRIVKTADKIASLRSKMDALKDVQIPTEQYKSIETDITKAEKELQKLIEKQAKMQNEGKDSGIAWDRLNQRIQASKDYIEYAKEEMRQLVDAGKAFTLGSDTEEYAKLGQQLKYAENDLTVLNQRHDELIAKQDKASDGYKRLGNTAKQSFEKINKSAKQTNSLLSSTGMGFKNILKYGLGMRSLYVLFNKLRSVIKEGFGNLYNESESFKNSVDSLKASTLTLKNSLAAAFRPLVEIALPYIQMVTDGMSSLLDKVGQFVAAIAGQKSYTKAIRQTTAALKEENKASNKQLSSLDKLNSLTSGDGDDTGAGQMFEEVSVDSGILDFLQKIKDFLKPIIDYAQNLKDVFAQGFWDGLGDWEHHWESVKDSVSSIKDILIGIWTDPAVLSAGDEWVQSVAYMLGSFSGSVASIGLTLATNLVGGIDKYISQNKGRIKKSLISMFDIRTDINNLFSELFKSIAYVFEAFASESGQQFTANIIGIFADAAMGIGEIASKLFRDVANVIIQPFVDNKEGFRTALEGFLSVLSEVSGTVKQGIDDTFDKLNEVYDEHFKPFFDSIAEGLSDTLGKFLDFWNGNVQPILDEWGEKFDEVWKDHIQPALDSFIGLFGSVMDYIKAKYENTVKPLIDWIIDNLLPVIMPILKGIGDALFTLFGIVGDVVGGIFGALGGLMDFLTGVFTGDWGKAWDGIVNVFKGIFNLIPALMEGMLNIAIDIINGLIGGINQITGVVGIPKIPDIPHLEIPRLATGTVVPPNREFMAVLGDNKREPEVVSPVSTIEQAVENALKRNGGSEKITIEIPIVLDGREISRVVQEYDREHFRRTGRPLFSY